jgi:aldose 1-epimerase
MTLRSAAWLATAVAIFAAAEIVAQRNPGAEPPLVARTSFGTMPDGAPIEIFTLKNRQGVQVRAINYGAIITSIRVPDRRGRLDDVVNGHDTLEGYLNRSRFFGAVVGRYGNRIAKGRFTLDGREYSLAVNNGPNHLHGGVKGFDKVVWKAEMPVAPSGAAAVAFTRISPDGEEGYPGTLQVRVSYTLTSTNELIVDYQATTDKPTPVNLTQHSYFNLAGHASGDILDHVVTIGADSYTPVDATLIPTGEIASVANTPFDFRRPTRIGARIDDDHPQLKIGGGYDHNFVLRPNGTPAVRVEEPKSGRTLEVTTTEPGVQFVTANRLDGTITGKGGAVYGRRSGFCLETQHFPDSPNQPSFPSTILRPDRRFESRTVFRFGVMR